MVPSLHNGKMGGVLIEMIVAFVAIWSSQAERAQSLSVYMELSDGTHVVNHGFLVRGQLRNNPLHCVTSDNTTCCSSAESGGAPLGRWYYPNQTEVPPESTGWQFYITRGPGVVRLHRNTGGVSGIYYCDIPDQSGVNQSLYVGLYIAAESSGRIVLQNALHFQLLTEPTHDPPVFNLTCTTTGGPPTTVSWTRNRMTVLYNSSFVFSQTVTHFVDATYTNRLTITGRYPGEYNITALNENTDQYLTSLPVSSPFQVTAANPPTNLTAVQGSNRSILISWIAPVSGATVTGYQIYHQTDGNQDVVDVGDNVTEYTLTGLNSGLTYNISLLALSVHLPSPIAGPEVVTLGGTDATNSLPDVTPTPEDTASFSYQLVVTYPTADTPDVTPHDIPSTTIALHNTLYSTPANIPTGPNATFSATTLLHNALYSTPANIPTTSPNATLSATTPLHNGLYNTFTIGIPTTGPYSTPSPTSSLGTTSESNDVFPRAVVGGAFGAGILFGVLICTMTTCLFFLWRWKSKLAQVAPLLPEQTVAEK